MANGVAIAGLVVNIFIPGVGTLINKKIGRGITQLLLYILGFILAVTSPILAAVMQMGILGVLSGLGGLLMFGMWVWGVVDGILILKNS